MKLFSGLALFILALHCVAAGHQDGRFLVSRSESAAGSLTTTLVGGNNHNGAMFDLTAVVDLHITAFEWLCVVTGATNVEVYYVTDRTSYVGKQADSSLWTLHHRTDTIEPELQPTLNRLDLHSGLVIYAGETVGIYFSATDVFIAYTNGPLGSFSTPELVFEDRGLGVEYPFGSTYSPRLWNGVIHYNLGVPSPSPSPSLSPSPSPSPSLSPSPSPSLSPSPSPSPSPPSSAATRPLAWMSFLF